MKTKKTVMNILTLSVLALAIIMNPANITADDSASQTDKNTALQRAIKKKDLEAVKAALERGADLNATLEDGASPLMFAALENDLAIATLLLDRGADVNWTATEGMIGATALMVASFKSSAEIVQLLIERGADVHVEMTEGDAKGMSALLFAEMADHQDAVEILKKAGATLRPEQSAKVEEMRQAMDRSNASLTQAHMRAIGTALGSYYVDNKTFPIALTPVVFGTDILKAEYYNEEALKDGWGEAFLYVSDGTSYSLISYGKDKTEGPGQSQFDEDVIYADGEFVSSPELVNVTTNPPKQGASPASRTRATMREIAVALGSYYVDYDVFPASQTPAAFNKEILSAEYYDGPYEDAWGEPFIYVSDGNNYSLTSYGEDKAEGPGQKESDADIVYANGQLVSPSE